MSNIIFYASLIASCLVWLTVSYKALVFKLDLQNASLWHLVMLVRCVPALL